MESKKKEELDCLDRYWGVDSAGMEVYQPGESALVPESGAWAMIRRLLPPLEGRIDEKMRVGRIFWIERVENTDEEGFRPDGTYKVKCQSPWGEVCLWPYEYATVTVPNLMDYWQAGEMIFHPLNIDQARLNDVTFYARSRGIGLAEAAVMALGSLDEPVGWFEPHSELAPVMEDLAKNLNTTLAQHIRQNPRLKAA